MSIFYQNLLTVNPCVSLDEPEARAAMIWIVGEYAERIDNADELLESFLEGFHDESTQVSPQVDRPGPPGPLVGMDVHMYSHMQPVLSVLGICDP